MKIVGEKYARSDGVVKVRGEALYTTDLQFPGMLFGAIFRSPVAAGRILHLDISAAENSPGVHKIITASDAPRHRHGLVVDDEQIFTSSDITYAGEPIAAIAATSLAEALAALKKIRIEIDEITPIVDLHEAIDPKCRLIHQGWKDFGAPEELFRSNNIVGQMVYDDGDVDKILNGSDFVIENEFVAGRQYQAYMEPKGVVASYENGRFTVHVSHQFPFNVRDRLAKALGIKSSAIRVVGHHIGGGFGGKLDLGIEPFACVLAKSTGRPVKLIQSRAEDMATCPVRENAIIHLRTGVNRDGQIIATDMDVIMDAGAAAGDTPYLSSIPLFLAGAPYKSGRTRVRCRVVYTNTPSTGAFRGVSGTYINFAVERQMDEIAKVIGMDRRQLRLKNLLHDGDCFLNGQVLSDASILDEAFALVESRAPWTTTGKGKLRGVGIAAAVWLTNPLPGSATMKLNEDGTLGLITAATENGSGAVAMGLRQIAAQEFGLEPDDVLISMPDTDVAGYDAGSQGSRTTHVVGRAIQEASIELRSKIISVAAEVLEALPGDIEIVDGQVGVAGVPASRIPLSSIAIAAKSMAGPLVATGSYRTPAPEYNHQCATGLLFTTFPTLTYHVHLAEVEVDPATGNTTVLRYIVAQEVGKVVNPDGVRGQIQGGVAQGLGYVLYENLDIGTDGKYRQKTLEAYRLPIAGDIPEVEIMLLEHPDLAGPHGVRGVAEPPIVPVAAAIANAISDAIGAPLNTIPVRPIDVLDGIRWAQEVHPDRQV
ncbi:MAG: xanthine dehydrogenase family protein molybdopterin-binding subunit [Acidimicrobiaceae bacterium]|nr:xanthine dehydrogenase family protein molybdopterin-binding subunit [Acidimicrobiaceae bacterium]